MCLFSLTKFKKLKIIKLNLNLNFIFNPFWIKEKNETVYNTL